MASKCELCDEKACEKDVRVSFCPKCKSRSVGYVFAIGNLFGVVPKMRCRDCDFEMASFPVLVTSQEKLKKAVEEMKTRRAKKKVASKRGARKK